MTLITISSIINLIGNISKSMSKIIDFLAVYRKRKTLKRKYKNNKDITENGDIDELNNIFKN